MAISIDTGRGGNPREIEYGLIVPPAAVWGGGSTNFSRAKVVHIRTLGRSNEGGSLIPRKLQQTHSGHAPGMDRGVREHMEGTSVASTVRSPWRSIIESAKQWVGGAIFGLVIFGGILFSQQGQEEPLPTYSEAHLVGVTLN